MVLMIIASVTPSYQAGIEDLFLKAVQVTFVLNPRVEYKQSAFTLSSRIKIGRQKIEEAKLKLLALNDIKLQYEGQQPFESINLAICSPIDANTGIFEIPNI